MPNRTRLHRSFVASLLALTVLLILLATACSSSKADSNSTATTAGQPAVGTNVAAIGSPVAAKLHGSVVVDFTGAPQQHAQASKTFEVDPGTKALDAIKSALGAENLGTKDFGGDLGVFITGFYGIEAEGNHFWEFSVNGKASDVGVSSYVVQDGDVLSFRYASF